jgi:signal transduction histidine kinase
VDSFKNFERFHKVQINLDVPEDFCLHTDKNFFYSILQNFIENGIKYSDPAKDNCFLKIKLEERQDKLLIYFEDNGLGISQDNIGRIFDMFYKVNDGSEGTGLGLYLVKHNLEKLGGKLSVESHLGKGSVFTIEFPKEASLVKVQI